MTLHTIDVAENLIVHMDGSYVERRGAWVTTYQRKKSALPASRRLAFVSAPAAIGPGATSNDRHATDSYLPQLSALTESLASGGAAPGFGDHVDLARSALLVNANDRTPIGQWAKNLLASLRRS